MTDTLARQRDAAKAAREFFEAIRPADLDRIPEIYADDARFRDPFNDVRGVAAIGRIYARMFEELDEVRFVVRDSLVDEGGAMLTWDMGFRVRRWRPASVRSIHGATHLRFAADGRISYHRDYWDAANELYAQLPIVGPLMRYLKRRLA
jgi:ketosteroid isomerase-like protein